MPALRGIHPVLASRSRRRSSLFAAAPTKPGVYAVPAAPHLPPRPISFAPNVTPVTFNESSDSSSPSTPEPLSPGSQPRLFPPSETPAPPPARKRQPPGKRRSQGYIPRPPNAFMLFRADFVRQKHVPGSIETNHGSLSKIIGNCWRSLPAEEKKVWEQRAKQEKAAHKVAYPHYRFRPVHNKNKKKAGADASKNAHTSTNATDDAAKHQSFEEEIRCEEVTQLLLEGKKGEELAQALRDLEKRREQQHQHHQQQLSLDGYALMRGGSETPSSSTAPSTSGPYAIMSAPQPSYPLFGGGLTTAAPLYMHRRSSSVPLPVHNPQAYDWNGGDYAMDSAAPYTYALDPMLPLDNTTISIPSVPFLPPPSSGGIAAQNNNAHVGNALGMGSTSTSAGLRPPSPIGAGGLTKSQRMMLGHRRSSSAGAAFGGIQRSWTGLSMYGDHPASVDGSFSWVSTADVQLQRDDSALPEADLSLFNPSFLTGGPMGDASMGMGAMSPAESDVVTVVGGPSTADGGVGKGGQTPSGCFSVADLYNGLPPNQQHPQALGPFDTTGLDATQQQQMSYQAGQEFGKVPMQFDDGHYQPQAHQHQSHLQDPQQQHQQQHHVADTPPPPYDAMYMAEQEAAHHAFVMGGYEDVGGEGGAYDLGAYVNVDGGYEGAGQYVSC